MAAVAADDEDLARIAQGLARMAAAERGEDDGLDADIDFHVAILLAAKNPFYAQFREMVATALNTSIRFTNTIVGRSASVAQHAAVADAIAARDPHAARNAMRALIGDVLDLIEDRGGEG